MKKIEEILDGVYQVENFISNDLCQFIIDNINNEVDKTPRKNIYGSIQSKYPDFLSFIGEYSEKKNYNLSIDIVNNIFLSMGYIVSEIYKEQHYLKQTFYSVMKPGSDNEPHLDNYYYDDGGQLILRKKAKNDKSCVLYLNDNYSGGTLDFISYKKSFIPKTGTLIIFEGNDKKLHGVSKVIDGDRCNIITFFEPQRKDDML